MCGEFGAGQLRLPQDVDGAGDHQRHSGQRHRGLEQHRHLRPSGEGHRISGAERRGVGERHIEVVPELGSQSGGASDGLSIWGNWKSGKGRSPWARAAGPPRSNSQYQRAKTILTTAMRAMLATRIRLDRRLICFGLATTNPIRSSASTAGSNQTSRIANLRGRLSCNPIAAATTMLTGHRVSPRVTCRQAGTSASPTCLAPGRGRYPGAVPWLERLRLGARHAFSVR